MIMNIFLATGKYFFFYFVDLRNVVLNVFFKEFTLKGLFNSEQVNEKFNKALKFNKLNLVRLVKA